VIDELMARYRVVRLAADQTGMGEKPVEDMQRRHGTMRVEGVIMSPPRQLDIATAARQRFEDRKVRIPMGDVALRADLHKLKKVIGPTGNPRLVADRDGEGHADRTWAGFLGIAAAETGEAPIDFTPLGQLRDTLGLDEEFTGSSGPGGYRAFIGG
jgi:phage FluMu gp28-like protein